MQNQWDSAGIFTPEQLDHLLQVIKTSNRRNKERDYVLIKILSKLGIRISQALSIKIDNIDFDKNIVKLPKDTSKTKNFEIKYLDPEISVLLRRYITKYLYKFKEGHIFYAERLSSIRLSRRCFTIIYYCYLEECGLIKQIGICKNGHPRYKYNLHSLRHYFINETIKANPHMHLSEIKEATGHKYTSTLESWYRSRIDKPKIIKEIFLNNYTREKTKPPIWEEEIKN